MKKLVIIGAGGVGRETAQLVADINLQAPEWQLLGFVDDAPALQETMIEGIPVLGTIDCLNSTLQDCWIICAVSNPVIKQQIIRRLKIPRSQYATLIHPTAVIAKNAVIGSDVIIQAFCFISVNTKIADHVQLNPQCGIGHDAEIGKFSSLYWNVNLSGHVKTGMGCLFGTKSTVLQNLEIGNGSIIGAAANVIASLPAYCTVVGNPARITKMHEHHSFES